MKKLLVLLFSLFLLSTTSVFAETYICPYKFGNEINTAVFKRDWNLFNDYYPNGSFQSYNIINEVPDFIHLYNNVGKSASIIVIDKILNTFVMINIEYKQQSAIIKGKCTLTN